MPHTCGHFSFPWHYFYCITIVSWKHDLCYHFSMKYLLRISLLGMYTKAFSMHETLVKVSKASINNQYIRPNQVQFFCPVIERHYCNSVLNLLSHISCLVYYGIYLYMILSYFSDCFNKIDTVKLRIS